MNETNGPAPWATVVRYADLRKLLTRLGYDCNYIADKPVWGNTVRVCLHSSSGPRIAFTDRPPDEFVSPQTLYGVRRELDKFGVMSGEEFDHWAKRRAKAEAARATTGANGAALPRKSRGSAPGKRPGSEGSRRSGA